MDNTKLNFCRSMERNFTKYSMRRIKTPTGRDPNHIISHVTKDEVVSQERLPWQNLISAPSPIVNSTMFYCMLFHHPLCRAILCVRPSDVASLPQVLGHLLAQLLLILPQSYIIIKRVQVKVKTILFIQQLCSFPVKTRATDLTKSYRPWHFVMANHFSARLTSSKEQSFIWFL